ncbi:efflux RND transporter periplasmic adaptor subunit [Brevibacillus sp. B_LB10_24]|uniref:efflux RND transporter periplasmic adaptor subunit n=1 Tax=Brevibacillus sp. B_LB10_24 TaxID=3380645 RepID=UPI0038B705F4
MKKGMILATAIVLAVATGCSEKQGADAGTEEKTQKIVNVFTVTRETGPIPLLAAGIAEANREAVLSFGVSGKIAAVNVEKGSRVSEGQLLASLDAGSFQQAAAAADGQVQEASARKSQTMKGASEEAIAQQRLSIESAIQKWDKAAEELDQKEKLFAGGAISQSELDDARRAKQQAQISVKNEQISLDKMLKGAEAADIASANASVQRAASEAAQARKTLQDAKIIAPFAGSVVEVTQQAGELTGPGQALIHLVDLTKVKVTLKVTGDVVSQFQEGKSVSITGESGQKSTGTVTYVSPVIDEKTGKFRIEIIAPNDSGEWRGGMVANVEFPRSIKGLVVPLSSVGLHESERYVLAVEDGVIKRRTVHTGQLLGDKMEILDGIQPGDQLITNGITYFVEGERVVAKGE